MSTLLESLRDGRVLHLNLNRPAKRNALNAELCRELVEALETAGEDDSIGAILLTAAGKSFCAGMDLTEAADPDRPADIDFLHQRLFSAGARLTTPTVAGVHGAALAGGTGLAANCHIVVAAPDATFGLTEVRLGLWPFLVFHACAAAMTERRAVELALTGRVFDAVEAHSLGLVHELAADPQARAAEIARQVAAFSSTAIRKGLEFVHQSAGMNWSDAATLARRVRLEVFESPGYQEGLRAFSGGRMSSHVAPNEES